MHSVTEKERASECLKKTKTILKDDDENESFWKGTTFPNTQTHTYILRFIINSLCFHSLFLPLFTFSWKYKKRKSIGKIEIVMKNKTRQNDVIIHCILSLSLTHFLFSTNLKIVFPPTNYPNSLLLLPQQTKHNSHNF